MPIFYTESLSSDYSLAVAHNTESVNFFEKEMEHTELVEQIKALRDNRKVEILSSHKVISELMDRPKTIQFEKDDYNKPQLINSDLQMSISHSGDHVAGIISKYDAGIDIQREVPKIHRIQNKFLSDQELSFIVDDCSTEMLHVMWGAKESMYKAYGKKNVTFKTELIINPFKYNPRGMQLSGSVQKNDYNERFTIYARKIGDFHLVFAICNTEQLQA